MKLSDLDEIIDRRGTDCLKYDFAKERGKPEGLLPFWIADMDFKVAPAIMEALEKRVAHGIFGYSETKEDYFEALAAWQKKYFHWTVHQDWLVKTPGVVPAIHLSVKAFTEEGDGVLVNQPVYYPFLHAIEKNRRKLVNSPLQLKDGRYAIDFEDMERKIEENHVKLAILCSPHNPAGRVWTREELETYAKICISHDVIIVSDEIHEDFTYPGHPHTTFGSLRKEAENRCIVCTSPSKTFNIAGLQNSNIWIPNPELREKFRDELDSFGYDQMNVLGLVAAQAAYQDGEEWLTLVKTYIKNNLDFTRDFLKDIPKIKLIEPEGTYLIWLDMRDYHLTEEELEHKVLNDCHLWLDEGKMFGKEGEGFLRINLACPRKTLEQGLKQLKEGFEK